MRSLLIKAAMLALAGGAALAHDASQHAQMTPAQREWFGKQTIPKGAPNEGMSCCSSADGQFAEEDIREGHYWTRFPAGGTRWYQVPDAVVIIAPNRNGAAAVWWGGAVEGYANTIYIRCFAPGPKL